MGAPVLPSDAEVFDALASLFAYPSERFPEEARAAAAVLSERSPALGRAVAPLLLAVTQSPPHALEERYSQVFDWSPTACLEVGWHLYGEQYERGAFLVEMRRRLREVGVEEGTDLPDHLTSILRWLGRADPEEAARFAAGVLLPALAKIREGLEATQTSGKPSSEKPPSEMPPPGRQDLVPWLAALEAVRLALTALRGPAAGDR